MIKRTMRLLVVALLPVVAIFSYWYLATPHYLTFSDSAKTAMAARSFLEKKGLTVTHSFFDNTGKYLFGFKPDTAFDLGTLPLPALILAGAFWIMPITDTTVTLVGGLVFILSAYLMFQVTKKMFNLPVALVALVLFSFQMSFLEYAVNASSEIFFILEILLFFYLWYLFPRLKLASLVPVGLMFLTRPQAILIPISVVLTAICGSLMKKFSILKTLMVLISGLGLIFFIIFPSSIPQVVFLPWQYSGVFSNAASVAPGVYLRGMPINGLTPAGLSPKILYNLYNFVKQPERLASPVILAMFIISAFLITRPRFSHYYFVLAILALFSTLAAATIPNARYVHPVIPLVIIFASYALMKLASRYLATALVVGLIIAPVLGHIYLDYRFRAHAYNLSQPPITKVLPNVMAKYIPRQTLVITNLDAWAAWYEGLTTMWFPLSPDQLIPSMGKQNYVEYIVITNYLENDSDFALGEWREVVDTPEHIQNKFLQKNFKVLTTFTIPADQVYENQPVRGTILARISP